MNVLLCTPYNINPQVTQGGIAIWAQNIMDYYNNINTDLQIEVVPYDRKIRKQGGVIRRVLSGIIDYYSAIKNTRRALRNQHFDVLHICTSASISLAKDIVVLRLAKRNGVKAVVHFHFGRTPELAQINNWEWKLLKRVVKLADEVATIDLKTYTSLKEFGYNNIQYLPNPLAQHIIKHIEDNTGSVVRNQRKICFVGHVIPSKGVYELVEACKDIEEDIELCVVGSVTPEVKSKMKAIANNAKWLVFKGEMNHNQVIDELLSSNIFILPSYTEGFPNVILESMACGCAIVSTTVGAIPEMLDLNSNEPSGLCCEPKDVEGLRRNIVFYLKQPAEARNYAERAKKRVNEMYAIPVVWEQLLRIWRNC